MRRSRPLPAMMSVHSSLAGAPTPDENASPAPAHIGTYACVCAVAYSGRVRRNERARGLNSEPIALPGIVAEPTCLLSRYPAQLSDLMYAATSRRSKSKSVSVSPGRNCADAAVPTHRVATASVAARRRVQTILPTNSTLHIGSAGNLRRAPRGSDHSSLKRPRFQTRRRGGTIVRFFCSHSHAQMQDQRPN